MKNGTVIESKRYKNVVTGATASIYGSCPWYTAAEEANWTVESNGWTIEWSDGTVGIGKKPFATKAEAEAWLAKYNAKKVA